MPQGRRPPVSKPPLTIRSGQPGGNVIVGLGVWVGVLVKRRVAVGVDVAAVGVCVRVGVAETRVVGVAVPVAEDVGVGVGVDEARAVGVAVRVDVGVGVDEARVVGVAVRVTVGVGVAVSAGGGRWYVTTSRGVFTRPLRLPKLRWKYGVPALNGPRSSRPLFGPSSQPCTNPLIPPHAL